MQETIGLKKRPSGGLFKRIHWLESILIITRAGLEQRPVDENMHSVWFGLDFRLYTATYDDI